MNLFLGVKEDLHAQIESIMIFFRLKVVLSISKEINEYVPGVSYCSQPSGWMDSDMFTKLLEELSEMKKRSYWRKKLFHVNSFSGDNETGSSIVILSKINTQLRKSLKSATDL